MMIRVLPEFTHLSSDFHLTAHHFGLRGGERAWQCPRRNPRMLPAAPVPSQSPPLFLRLPPTRIDSLE